MQMPWAVVIACCVGMFAATASGSSRAPFLLDMAGDLNVTLPAIANLFGVTSVCWGLSAYVAGLGSDRFGRGPFLLGAPIMLALSLVAMSLVYDYWLLVACVAIAGIGCGAFTATSMAEVSLRTESNQRGRALGWVMGGAVTDFADRRAAVCLARRDHWLAWRARRDRCNRRFCDDFGGFQRA